MSTPSGDSAFLRELDRDVRAELAEAQAGRPDEDAAGEPTQERLYDQADAEREEVGLRSLLGAVESLENGGPSQGV